MRHIVLLPFGSAGDVFPFIWLAKMLRARGHRVTMVSTCLFSEAAASADIPFIPLGSPEEYEAIARDRRIWKLGVGTKVVLDYAVEWSGKYLEAVESLGHVDLMLAPLTSFGARMAREKHGIPLINVHLQPMVFVSAYETPLLHPALRWFRCVPVSVKKLLFSLFNLVNFLALPGVKKVCAAHGVKPPRSLWPEWWDSPDGVLALFPEWFASPQPDWPPLLLQWDFPMEDLGAEVSMQPALRAFLEAGERPVVFTPGSSNIQAERFFQTAMEVVKRLGIRAVFATRMELAIPSEIVERIFLVDFVPFGKLLEQSSILVHHGGIGTMSQGFRAGLPQLVMAMSHDQPDNAERLKKSGAGIGLTPSTFTADRVEKELGRLLHEPSFRDAATRLMRKMEPRKETRELVIWIEGVMERKSSVGKTR